MRTLTLVTALLLCSLSWTSVSGSDYQTVEVQAGHDVTLQCSNISSTETNSEWFRVVNRTKPSCIASLYSPEQDMRPCSGFQSGKFNMTSNMSTLFLRITQVDLSDSGLYFCGFYIIHHTIISNVTLLNVNKGSEDGVKLDDAFTTTDEPDGIRNPLCVTLGGLTLLCMLTIVVLGLKVKQLQRGGEEQRIGRNKNLDSDNLKDATITFLPTTIRNRRPASDKQVETHVIYAARTQIESK